MRWIFIGKRYRWASVSHRGRCSPPKESSPTVCASIMGIRGTLESNLRSPRLGAWFPITGMSGKQSYEIQINECCIALFEIHPHGKADFLLTRYSLDTFSLVNSPQKVRHKRYGRCRLRFLAGTIFHPERTSSWLQVMTTLGGPRSLLLLCHRDTSHVMRFNVLLQSHMPCDEPRYFILQMSALGGALVLLARAYGCGKVSLPVVGRGGPHGLISALPQPGAARAHSR